MRCTCSEEDESSWAAWRRLPESVSLAAAVLGVASLTAFVGAIWAYLPNVLAAVLIFLVASAIAGAVVALVKRTMGDTPLGSIVATAVPVLVLTIATFMILEQLKIAHDIVVTTYTLIGMELWEENFPTSFAPPVTMVRTLP